MPIINRQVLSRFKKAYGQIPYLARALRLVWAATPSLTLGWLVLLVIQGILPAVSVYLTRALVNALVAAIEANGAWADVRTALIIALIMGGIMLLTELLRVGSNWLRAVQAERVQDHISELIHVQSMAVDLAFYDLPDYFDHLHRARIEASYRPIALLENLGNLLQSGITLVAMGLVLLSFGLLLPLLLILSTLPALFVVLHHAVRQHRWRLHHTTVERRARYYDWLLTARETAAELRLFGLGDHFRDMYQDLRRHLRDGRMRLVRNQGLAELAAGASALLVMAGVMIWMTWQALLGFYTLGDLALFYQAFTQGQSLARSLLEQVGQIYANSLFLSDLFAFLALKPTVVDPPEPLPLTQPEDLSRTGPAIAFSDVTFQYPGRTRTVLSDFNLAVPAGQIAAIVGENGAGKSTLVKLLCRFYDPESGTIEVGGVDVRRLSLNALRTNITVLFQQPIQYNATVAENIGIGVWPYDPTESELQSAARNAGADQVVARLPQEYASLLGAWFAGGTDLSTGEWQRIALARAYLRQAPIVVLDEPTSAIDPWAEADWLKRFRRLAMGQTAIVITHRFTTARYADVIHVMEQGRVVEAGSHEALLGQNGRYAKSWREQMRLRRATEPDLLLAPHSSLGNDPHGSTP